MKNGKLTQEVSTTDADDDQDQHLRQDEDITDADCDHDVCCYKT